MSRDHETAHRTGSQRSIPRPRVAPGALRDLKHLLHKLYMQAGTPPVARISELIGADDDLPGSPSKDSVHRILGSAELPPRQADVISVACVLARSAGWDPVHTMEQVRQAWVTAQLVEPLGSPVAELDPFALEVHRAIEAEDESGQHSLPSYVEREHDRTLRRAVARAVEGTSTLVTLTGGSSTGKTRALWEALQLLPPSWRVWQPLDSGALEALLSGLDAMGPQTVVWLNEAQRFLLTDGSSAGEQVAAALRRTLGDRGRAPVLILATLWPEYWNVLTTEPRPGSRDPHSHARRLLDSSAIRVPELFAGDDLGSLTAASTADRRLALALRHADEGHVTQYLAGVPALLQRHANAPAPARALIDAAMDLRRLGHGEAIPLDLLEQAAYAYLTDLQFELLPEDWLEKAIAFAAEPQRGIRGPLTRVRSRDRRPASTLISYRLADPLDHSSRRERRRHAPPHPLWDCVVAHASAKDAHHLGKSARAAGLPHTAMILHHRAAAAGNAAAALDAGELLAQLDRPEEALEWYETANRLGSPHGLRFAASMLAYAGEWDRAGELFIRSARSGYLLSLFECVENMRELEYPGDPDKWLHQALTEVLKTVTFEKALECYRLADDRRNEGRMLLLMEREAEALQVFQQAAADGNFYCADLAAGLIEREHGVDGALAWFSSMVKQGGIGAIYPVQASARILKGAARTEEAISLLKEWAEAGDAMAAEEVVALMTQSDQAEAADAWLQGISTCYPHLAYLRTNILARGRHADEAENILRDLAILGSSGAAERLAEFLEKTGKTAEALRWYRTATEMDAFHAVWGATRLMIKHGRGEEAVDWLRSVYGPDSIFQRLEAAEWALSQSGRPEEAARLRHFGWEPDGTIAAVWRVTPPEIH